MSKEILNQTLDSLCCCPITVLQCCRSEEEGPDVRGEEGEVEELLSKSKSREEDRLGKSATCSTLLSKSKSREGGDLEDTCSTLPTAPTERSLNGHTRYALYALYGVSFHRSSFGKSVYSILQTKHGSSIYI